MDLRTSARESCYEGDFLDDLPHGRGKVVFSNGLIFEGSVLNGKISGFSTFTFPDGSCVYKCEFVNDIFQGNCEISYSDKSFYRGSNTIINARRCFSFDDKVGRTKHIFDDANLPLFETKITGIGEMYYSKGGLYVGNFMKGKKHGRGRYYIIANVDNDDDKKTLTNVSFDGMWEFDRRVGVSPMYTLDEGEGGGGGGETGGALLSFFKNDKCIASYRGEITNCKPQGQGMLNYNDGTTKYVGLFKNGLYFGFGKLTTSFISFEGYFGQGEQRNGIGSETCLLTGALTTGYFENNKFIGAYEGGVDPDGLPDCECGRLAYLRDNTVYEGGFMKVDFALSVLLMTQHYNIFF